jgi:hypothetical protein
MFGIIDSILEVGIVQDSVVGLRASVDQGVDDLTHAFKRYVNLISSHHDADNIAYDDLLKEETRARELLEIIEVFDSEEDNDEIRELEDPLFNGSLGKDQGVSFDSDPPSPSKIPTNSRGSALLRNKIRLLCQEYEIIFSQFVKIDPASVPPTKLHVNRELREKPFNRLPVRQSTAY